MDIYDMLKKDHNKVLWLLDRLVKCAESKNPEWKPLLEQLFHEFIPHSRAEEDLFYSAIRERDSKAKGIGRAFSEHAAAEMQLNTLMSMKTLDVKWTRLANSLRDNINSHVEEEESEMFATARALFTSEEATEMGRKFEVSKTRVKTTGATQFKRAANGNTAESRPNS